jgi:membrane peptidoglycan carboxypeptidase
VSSRDVNGFYESQSDDGFDRSQDWPGDRGYAGTGSRGSAARSDSYARDGHAGPPARPEPGSTDPGPYGARRRRADGYASSATVGTGPRPVSDGTGSGPVSHGTGPRFVPNGNGTGPQRAESYNPRGNERYDPLTGEPRPSRGPGSATQDFPPSGRTANRQAGRVDQYSDGRGAGGRGPGSGGPGGRGPGGRGPGDGNGGGRGRGVASGAGRGKVKIKGSWWRHWTWRKVAGVAAAMVGGFVLLIVAGISYAYATTAVPSDVSLAATQQQSTVYFNDGKSVVGTFGTTDRQVLTYNEISPYMRDAVVAAEDRGFYTEGGVSPKGIVRAAYEDVFNSGGSGGSLQGGSTITQQFVRNYYANIGSQQTATRKIKEIFVSLKVAKGKSKDWILTNYLNTIYLGEGAYGVGAAAETYFGVPASKLTVAQSAMIAATIQSPSYYPTPAGRAALEARWHYVLNGMVGLGDLTAAQAAAQKFPTVLSAQDQHTGSSPYDQYLLGLVKNELEATYHYSAAQIDNDGLHITTTVSQHMMDRLYASVNDNEKLMAEDGGAMPSYALVGAELQNPSTGAIIAFYGGVGANTPVKQCHFCQDDTVLSREQVGSSFKPYVLATAVQQGMNVQSTQLDGYSPLWIPPDTAPTTPAARSADQAAAESAKITNDDNEDFGPISVAQAEAQSSNTAFTDLIHRVGTQNVVNMAKQFGVNAAPLKEGGSGLQGTVGEVGMALGIDSLSVNEQNTMLATLDDNGTYHAAHVIQQITQGTVTTQAQVKSTQVLTPAQDSQVQYAMSFDTVNGTGTAAAMSDGRPIIAKTGTTDNAQSAFFIGAIPQYALSVGIFTENQSDKTTESLNGLGGNVGGGFGGYWPARIWNTFAEAEWSSLPVQQFQTPQFSGQTWNMFGAGGVPTVPSPTKAATKPTAQPSQPSQPSQPAQSAPAAAPSGQASCQPGDGACPGGNGNGGGDGGGGGGQGQSNNAALSGAVLLGPAASLSWLRARRRKRQRR